MFSQFPQMFTVIWGAHKIISVIIQTRLFEWSLRIGSWTLSLQQREYSPANTLREHLSLLSWCTLMSKQRSFFPAYWVFSITIKITLFCKKKTIYKIYLVYTTCFFPLFCMLCFQIITSGFTLPFET